MSDSEYDPNKTSADIICDFVEFIEATMIENNFSWRNEELGAQQLAQSLVPVIFNLFDDMGPVEEYEDEELSESEDLVSSEHNA